MSAYIFSKKHNIVYLNMPKSGCSTVKNCLYYLDNHEWLDNPLEIHREYNRELKGHFNMSLIRKNHTSFTFSFVRHPFKRSYSLFQEKILVDSPYTFPDRVDNLLRNRYGLIDNYEKNIEVERENFFQYLSFVDDTINNRVNYRADPHWLPQYDIISKPLYRGIDFIGRLENFQEDFRYVLDKIGVKEPLESKRFNENPSKNFTYSEVVNPELLELLNKIYVKDLEYFGYVI